MDDISKSYQALGLKPGASPEEMKQAYRDMVKVWHPDRFGHDERLRVMAQDKLKEINGAYETLKSHAFQESIAPEPSAAPEAESTAASPPPARNRAALWTTLGVLVFVLVAAAAFLILGKDHGVKAIVSPGTNTAIAAASAPTTDAQCSLSFGGNHGQLAIATTGSLTGTFTVEFWALTRQPKEDEMILSSRTPESFGLDIMFRQGNHLHTDVGNGLTWLAKNATARLRYKADVWYHIAYVATPDSFTVYVNGAAAVNGPIDPPGNPLLYDANHRLCFGLEKADDNGLDGRIADVRVWKTALTQAEIESGMKLALTGDEPGLMGWWRFAEGSGTNTADASSHGFNGTLTGDVSWSKDVPPAIRR
jgi:hypothetical protein